MGSAKQERDEKAAEAKKKWEEALVPLRAMGVEYLVNTPRSMNPIKDRSKNKSLAARTSETDPIKVSWVPSVSGIIGRLGATLCPGKHQKEGRSGQGWNRSLFEDLKALRTIEKGDVLVPLLDGSEFSWLDVEALVPMAEMVGFRTMWFPIRDGNIPTAPNLFSNFISRVLHEAKQGKRVICHCRGGVGRSGTVLVCCLIAHGMDPEDAILKVREARPNAVENPLQIRFCFDFKDQWSRYTATPLKAVAHV